MQGYIRRQGAGSWQYTIDIGRASPQRCQACRRRFWVERRPKETYPACGGDRLRSVPASEMPGRRERI
jgi:hypothetical protein